MNFFLLNIYFTLPNIATKKQPYLVNVTFYCYYNLLQAAEKCLLHKNEYFDCKLLSFQY